MIQIPQQEVNIGDTIEHEGKKLTAMKEYSSGKSFNESGFEYYMPTVKGVMGFKEC